MFGMLLLIMKKLKTGQGIADCGFSESKITNAGSGLPAPVRTGTGGQHVFLAGSLYRRQTLQRRVGGFFRVVLPPVADLESAHRVVLRRQATA
jgi:hypothetical protein